MTSVDKLADVVDVVIGVDTHTDTHAAAAVDAATGAVLAELSIEADAEGYAELVEFADELAQAHGALRAWAIEGTASHGRGLAVHLDTLGEYVIELDRPERAHRRGGVKSDPADAIRAAREALSRARLATPRGTTRGTTRGAGSDPDTAAEVARIRQALATLLMARRSAVQAAGDARRQLASAVITAPEPVRARLRGLTATTLVTTAARLRTSAAWAQVDIETTTAVACLRLLARRVQDLTEEAELLERQIKTLVTAWRADLLELFGLGPITAATVLCAWAYPGRIHSEAAFAKLAGVSPIEATSGQIHTRHRLNRYGDRRLNCALHTITITRQRHDPATRTYTQRRTTQGKNPREIRRCLKRYIARELFRILEAGPPTTP